MELGHYQELRRWNAAFAVQNTTRPRPNSEKYYDEKKLFRYSLEFYLFRHSFNK